MNYARIQASPRLQRVLRLLQNGLPWTTREIVQAADVCAVNSIVSELRANGFDIICKPVTKGRFEYRLIKDAKPQH